MSRDIQEPITTDGPDHGRGDSVTTHPAFAQIGASRVHGQAVLYGSDFKHNAFMTIRIFHSELHRNLHNDWHFGRDRIVEVALSEAQWATFVSSPNIGTGVPCTLQSFGGYDVPGLPDPAARHDQFKKEVEQKINKSLAEIDKLIGEINSLGLPNKKAATMKNRAETARRELGANLPFVAECFGEYMEETTEKAKTEIHGYMTNVLVRSGLDALAGGSLPLQIEHKKDD